MIRRVTPYPIEPPLQIWRCPMHGADGVAVAGAAAVDWSEPHFAFANRIRVISTRFVIDSEGERYTHLVETCDVANTCTTLRSSVGARNKDTGALSPPLEASTIFGVTIPPVTHTRAITVLYGDIKGSMTLHDWIPY